MITLHILNRLRSFSEYFYLTTPFENMKIMSKLKINKANGHNEILPFFLKISVNIIAHSLSAILNQCIAFGYFPDKLKIVKEIPAYKAGPTNQPGNYQPISLLPFMSKIFERPILNRLVSFLNAIKY